MKTSIAERLADANARVGRIIHIPTMIAADIEVQDSAVQDFLQDDLDDEVARRFDAAIPGLSDALAGFWKDFEKSGGGRSNRDSLLYDIASFVARRSTVAYLVQVQWQIKSYHRRGVRYPLGSYGSGWGYYATRWYAGKSIEACAQQGIREAHEEGRKAWYAAPQELARSRDEEE